MSSPRPERAWNDPVRKRTGSNIPNGSPPDEGTRCQAVLDDGTTCDTFPAWRQPHEPIRRCQTCRNAST